MSAEEILALDPQAAAYVRRISSAPVTELLAEHGDSDPDATLALVRRAVAAHLPKIA